MHQSFPLLFKEYKCATCVAKFKNPKALNIWLVTANLRSKRKIKREEERNLQGELKEGWTQLKNEECNEDWRSEERGELKPKKWG